MLVNESVNAMNMIALGNNTNKSKSFSKSDNQTSFADFLQPAKKDVSVDVKTNTDNLEMKDTPVIKDSVAETNPTNQDNDMDATDNTTREDSVSDHSDIDDAKVELKKDEKDLSSVNENTDNELVTDANLMEENLEVIQELLGNLVQQITQLLDITPEQLGEKLEELSMDFSDLLSEEGVKEVFLAVHSAEVSDMLVNEELNLEWNQFLEKFDELQQNIAEENEIDFAVVDDMFKQEYMPNEDVIVEETFEVPQKDLSPIDKKTNTERVVVQDENVEELQVDVKISGEVKQTETSNSNADADADDSSGRKDEKDSKKEVVNALGNAIDHLTDVQIDGVEFGNIEYTPVSGREIVNQIVEQIRVNMNQNNTSLEMQLYPEHLGKIQINVVSKDGVMTARIVAESEAAKQAIESGLANLRESFEKQDLKVDAIEVMVSTAGFANSNEEQASYEQQSGSGSRRRLDLSGLEEEETIEEEAEQLKMEYSGSSVSYMA